MDETDAIVRACAAGGGDPGGIERESALLAMLVHAAGGGDPGSIEREMLLAVVILAALSVRNRALKSKNVLAKVAGVTPGWSAAALANVLNEGAILTELCSSIPKVTQGLLLELVDVHFTSDCFPFLRTLALVYTLLLAHRCVAVSPRQAARADHTADRPDLPGPTHHGREPRARALTTQADRPGTGPGPTRDDRTTRPNRTEPDGTGPTRQKPDEPDRQGSQTTTDPDMKGPTPDRPLQTRTDP
eukprot:gene3446-13505_t